MFEIKGGMYLVSIMEIMLSIYMLVYGVLNPFEAVLKREQGEDDESVSRQPLVKSFFQLLVIIGVVCTFMYQVVYKGIELILSFKFERLSFTFAFLGIVFLCVCFIFFLIKFIQYIFLETSDFELTPVREQAVLIIGTFAYMVCVILINDDIKVMSEFLIERIGVDQFELIKMLLITFWFFSIMFFSVTFLLLSMHKIVIVCRWLFARMKKKIRAEKCNNRKDKPIKKHELVSEIIWNTMESLPGNWYFEKALFVPLWLLMVAVDAIILMFKGMCIVFKELGRMIMITFPCYLRDKCLKFFIMLQENQGKRVMLIARIALVCSFLVVYVSNRYNRFFTDDSFEVYEFIGSVIIIPYLVSQVGELKKVIVS